MKKRILLADDDVSVRESLAAALGTEGYQVVLAKNGQEALDLYATSQFDLVLLDLNMPVKNGWDTFEQITAQRPLVPIIIITAKPNQIFTALSAGAGALLEKPMEIPDLLETVRLLLAEPGEVRLHRLVGRRAPFYFPPSADAVERATKSNST